MLLLWVGSRRHDTSAVYHHIIILSFVGCQMRELKKSTIVPCIIDFPLLTLFPGLWIFHTISSLQTRGLLRKHCKLLLLSILVHIGGGRNIRRLTRRCRSFFFFFFFQPVESATLPPQEARPRTNSYIRVRTYSVKSTVESLRDLPVRSGKAD